MHANILNHGGGRYLWLSLLLCAAAIAAYLWHQPFDVPNGGSWLGYTLGTIAALLIVWLMLLGIRKRSYRNRLGSLRGWVSAHVYLGSALIVLSLLHSGFQFGWNLHTLTFVLMLAVIFSGFFGVYAYLRYPGLMTANRRGATREGMRDELAEIDQASLLLADSVSPEIHAIVLRAIETTRIGGGVFAQLRSGREAARAADQLQRMLEKIRHQGVDGIAPQDSALGVMVHALAAATGPRQAEALRKLIDLLARKQALLARYARDIQLQGLMELWLYLHVPLSFALLAALIGHVVAVFFYW